MLVQEGIDAQGLASKILSAEDGTNESSRLHGRGILRRIDVADGEDSLVRTYRHGGLLGRSTGEVFFTWPARPFRELAVTEKIRQRGVPTLNIRAAVVERLWGPFYRGWLVTRELRGAQDLWTALRNDINHQTGRLLLRAVAGGVRRMHLEGIYHADLNLKNILIRHENGGIGVYLIDFDKARLYPQKVSSLQTRRNLRRLLRSVRKLDPKRQYCSEEDWTAFVEFYHQGP